MEVLEGQNKELGPLWGGAHYIKNVPPPPQKESQRKKCIYKVTTLC